jgi:hypothetical protein
MEQTRRRWVPWKALTYRKWKKKITNHEQRHLSIKPSQDSSWDDDNQNATHLILARICLLSSFSRRPTRTSTARTRMTRATTTWQASSYQQTSEINGGLSTVSWRLRPRSWDNILKSLKMKLLCKYQWGSFHDNQDGWCIAYKQRSTTFHHVVRQSRRNLSLHLQWTPTHQPRINKNQERLMKEDHAIVCIFISRIGRCK